MVFAKVAIIIGARGRGSNMKRLIEACQGGEVPAEVSVVIAPKAELPAEEAALNLGVPVAIVRPEDQPYEAGLLEILDEYECDFICLAGFTRLLPVRVLEIFPNKVLNIHPALLPKFGGKGMYGRHVHEAVLASGESETGCTVHLVTPVYDEGRVLLQLKCPVEPDDTPESLAAKVLQLEHQAFPQALSQYIANFNQQ